MKNLKKLDIDDLIYKAETNTDVENKYAKKSLITKEV